MIVRGRYPRLRQFGVALGLLAPALLLFLTFVGYPAVRALRVSTQDWTGFSPRALDVGNKHYLKLFGEPMFRSLPLLVVVVGLAAAGMAAGQWLRRSLAADRIRLGIRVGKYSGLALAAVLLSVLLLWTFGPSSAGCWNGATCGRWRS